ncbi:ankyrin repeat domain-containing protein [Rickettsiales endosymbiont of Stachyamoeba lipophora]|uniref:ankyrin repeat domain-containing protein n=1 Tax=Rickettsiales endosymbiont of Stachyamoeba lipophora TaxID=2486578 RepID=UPI0013DDAD16|nr:ankyrin repeat domain-containing protein [Rickettsiales endosymbiont of Stachyamoeba lipophora]
MSSSSNSDFNFNPDQHYLRKPSSTSNLMTIFQQCTEEKLESPRPIPTEAANHKGKHKRNNVHLSDIPIQGEALAKQASEANNKQQTHARTATDINIHNLEQLIRSQENDDVINDKVIKILNTLSSIAQELLSYDHMAYAALKGKKNTALTLMQKILPQDADNITKLSYYLCAGDTEKALNLIAKSDEDKPKKFDVNKILDQDSQQTALHIAAFYGHEDLVTRLIEEYKADVDIKDINLNTALHLATRFNHTNVASLLARKVAKIDALNNTNFTALDLAVYHEDDKTANAIITVLKEKLSSEELAKNLDYALHIATSDSKLHSMVRLLVNSGAKCTYKDNQQCNPLHRAFKLQQQNTAEFLINNGANVEAIDGLAQTPLHYAAAYNFETTAKLIMQKINPNNVDPYDIKGFTPLYLAALLGNLALVKILSENGAALNALTKEKKGKKAQTALHIAASKGHTEIVSYLALLPNIDPSILDYALRTALHKAAYYGKFEVVRVLTTAPKHIDVNIQDNDGWTALHYAVKKGHTEIAKYLVQHSKANINLKNHKGKIAFDCISDCKDQLKHNELRDLFNSLSIASNTALSGGNNSNIVDENAIPAAAASSKIAASPSSSGASRAIKESLAASSSKDQKPVIITTAGDKPLTTLASKQNNKDDKWQTALNFTKKYILPLVAIGIVLFVCYKVYSFKLARKNNLITKDLISNPNISSNGLTSLANKHGIASYTQKLLIGAQNNIGSKSL